MKSILKISPVFLLAGMMISGLDILIAGPIATIYAACVAFFVQKESFNSIMKSALDNVKEMQIVFFILMMAYAMAEVFMVSGVGASIINMTLDLGVTGKTVAVVGLIITSLLSIATGTSWGTFAASAPIFLWLTHILGGNIMLTIGAIAGGSCFGDNIGLISETTVVSSGIQKVDVIDRIRHQGVWSGIVLFLGVIAFYSAGIIMDLPAQSGDTHAIISEIPQDVWTNLAEQRASAVTLLEQVKEGVPWFMALPLLFVLIAAFKGLPTLLCLFIGIISSFLLGYPAGTIDSTSAYLDLVKGGFEGAGSWVIVMMMWVGAFGGIMKLLNAFEPISKFILKISKNVRQLMFYNGTLSIMGNAALADEMAQIVTVGPMIKEMVEENVEGSEKDLYTLRLRNATFNDALGVFGSQLIPWHVYIGFYLGIATAVYPLQKFEALDIISYNFMAVIAVVSILTLTLTGLDKWVPLFALPKEPQVRLNKKK
ncbi:Na+/H+ antiporter NhaC family protein [Aureibacter tunicatorum]|uniref:Na+/H+ antiporter NhaC n=1 Tax=Aureibacter tunicatorum TaxID=866807 RepID=A0AAE3XJG7_9BACT|nr:Na+/H+ antiporter NhaC family protein [Aureibacter tunicatorum]MDR6237560.1 Na+/H+ antiporter NhaC [Aureibacter tunicatorum]BDD02594.1 sodium:proton antiporter [Aureibacter tunicatorum]